MTKDEAQKRAHQLILDMTKEQNEMYEQLIIRGLYKPSGGLDGHIPPEVRAITTKYLQKIEWLKRQVVED